VPPWRRVLKYLNSVDYSVIGVYFAILIVMGIYFQRIAARSIEHYFLGNKKMPWWLLGVSGMGMFIDMAGTMIIVSFLYMLGPRGLYIEFRGGAVLVLIFMLLWTGKWHRRSNCMTGAEWQIYRFGTGAGAQTARVVNVVNGVLQNVAMLAYLIKGAGLFLSMFLPYSPLQCAALMVGVTILYTMLSGFYGVVYTDLFQGFIILAAVIVVSVMASMEVTKLGGGPGLAALATEVTHTNQWMSSVPHWKTHMPKGYGQYSSLAMFAIFYLITNIKNGISSGADSRYFGARNERECGLLTFFWTWLMMFRWPMMIAFAILGLLLVRNLFPRQDVLKQARDAIVTYTVETEQPGSKPDLAAEADVEGVIARGKWPSLGRQVLASPATYPDLAANLQTALGSDWQAEFSRLILVQELIPKSRWEEKIADIAYSQKKYPKLIEQLQQILGPDWQRKMNLVSYEGTVNPERILPAVLLYRIPMGLRGLFVVALLAAAMSTFSPTVNSTTALFTRDIYQAFIRPAARNWELIGASYAFGALMTLMSFAMCYWIRSINDIWGWIIMGLGSGAAMPGVLRLYWWRFNATGVIVSLCVGLPAAIIQRFCFPDLDERLQFLIIMSISAAGAIIGTYLSKPTNRQVLENFYRTTRPFGLWGPLKHILPPDVRKATAREHFYDLVAIPFVFFWQVTLFLLPMQLVIQNYHAFGITLVIFVVALIGMYHLWYRQLPAAQEVPGVEFQATREGVVGMPAG
jgi:SSS family solute:Na+ symporter